MKSISRQFLYHLTLEKTLDKLQISKRHFLLFYHYNNLQQNALVVLSDSGTISEESAMLGFKALTIRDSMERPEALEAGTIVMSGIQAERVLQAIELVESEGPGLTAPREYRIPDTSTRVVNFLFSTFQQYGFWNGIRGH